MNTFSVLDLERELARQRELAEASRLHQFDARTLSRLALLPEWTTGLAIDVDLADGTDLEPLLDRLTEADLIERREKLGGDGQRHEAFWLRARARAAVARHLASKRGADLAGDLKELASALAGRVTDEPALAAWSEVVKRYLPDPSGLSLIRRIDSLVLDGRLGAATSLVATVRALGEILGGALSDAARRAQWRIDRAQRATEDGHHLRHYHRRAEVEEGLDDLLVRPTGTWALHLLGDGGVGKTMILRYLASGRYAADRGLSAFPVARTDFDHLDPRYPQQRPGELLLALAHELVGFGRSRGFTYSHRQFLDAADELHEHLARAQGDPDREQELLSGFVHAFARMITELPAPTVLVLDTCEELAKLYGLGAAAPAIDRTFLMLEMLHEIHDGVRIILAGRRWLVPDPETCAHTGGPVLSPRPYLRVLPVAGFTETEAQGYLDERQRRADAAPLPATLRTALLRRSRDPGSDRYNPFELSSYCEWVFSEPDLDPQELLSAPGDPYVERRIIGRLGDGAARDGLAVAAELGRFDLELAAPGWRRQGIDPAATFDEITAQEWVRVLSLDESGRPKVIEIDEHLRERIRTVTLAQPTRYPVDRRQLGRDAAEVIRRTPIGDIPSETVEAAVRLLPPVEAGNLWQFIEQIVTDQNAWGWAATVTARVGATEIPRAETDQPSVLAAVLATQAAARIHTGPPQGLAKLWRDVELAAERHPDDEQRAVLAARAALGRIAAGERGVALDRHLPVIASGAVPTGSVIAALESWAVGLPVAGTPDAELPATEELTAVVSRTDHPAVQAAVEFITAIGALRVGAYELAERHCTRAIPLAEKTVGVQTTVWADWVPPRGMVDRCRLARLLLALRRAEPLRAVPLARWRREALPRLATVDAERLVAATIQLELGHRYLDPALLEQLSETDHHVPERQPLIWPQLLVRPLVVEVAEAWSVQGQPERARTLLATRREAAVSAGTDPETIEACDLALLRLCRRYRTTEFFPSVHRLATDGSAVVRAEAWLVLTLVRGERPASPEEAGSWSGWWRCQDTHTLEQALLRPPEHPSAWEVDTAEFLAAVANEPVGGAQGRASGTRGEDPSTPWPHRLEDTVRRGSAAEGPAGAVARATLLAAETAALRFPAHWVAPLDDAARQLRQRGDQLGAAQAIVLAALAAARAGQPARVNASWKAYLSLGSAELENLGGWGERIGAIRTLLATGTPTPAASPELHLVPAPPPRLPVFPDEMVEAEYGSDIWEKAKHAPEPPDWTEAEQGPEPLEQSPPVLPPPVASRRAASPPEPSGVETAEPDGEHEAPTATDAAHPGPVSPPDAPATRGAPAEPVRPEFPAGSVSDTGAMPRVPASPESRPEPSTPPVSGSEVRYGSQAVARHEPPPAAGRRPKLSAPRAPVGSRPGVPPAGRVPVQAGQYSPRSVSWRLRAWLLLIFVGAALAGVALGLLVTWSQDEGMGALPGAMPGSAETLTWLGGTAAALVGVAVGLVALALLTNRREGYQFRSGRVITLRKATRPDRVLVDVREHEGLADLDGGLAARFGARIRRLRRISPRPRRGEVQLAVSDPDAARQLAAQLQLPRPSRRRRALTVLQLDIARQLEIAPWEERARTAVRASQGPSPCPVVVYRCAGSPPARPSGPWERALYRGPAHLRPLRAFQPGVACLVGTPVSTAAGWRLRVPDSAGMLSKAPSRGTAAGEQLLALSELGLSGRQLVVLQAEPVDTPPRHLDALLPGFIGLSRDALDHGARAVLVMPPLPDHLAAASLDLIGREVGGRRPSGPPSSLVVLLTRLQELVRADAPAGTPTADRELNALLFLGT